MYHLVHAQKPANALDAKAYICIKRVYPGSDIIEVQLDEIISHNDQLQLDNRRLYHHLDLALDEIRVLKGGKKFHIPDGNNTPTPGIVEKIKNVLSELIKYK